ncbi:MAG: hypothetical protein HYZ83_07410 [Candidatus Omnitrophica bacterium]|nr:hypothetical protein [Candidatus Omnitrophota bacterium]
MNQRPSTGNILGIVLISTLATFTAGLAAYILIQNKIPASPFVLWDRWDTLHFLQIAQKGYPSLTDDELLKYTVNFPLYPLLIRALTFISPGYLLNALLISNLCFAAACVFFYRLLLLDYSPEIALRSVFYLSIFPSAYFFHAGYSESLFLMLAVGSFYAARKGGWPVAGLLGMLATLTRVQGLILLPALAVEYLQQKNFRLKNCRFQNAAALALIPLGFGIFMLMHYFLYGDFFHYFTAAKKAFGKELAFPWKGMLHAWGGLTWRGPAAKISVSISEMTAVFTGLILSLLALRKSRLSYGVYMILAWILMSSMTFWLSTPRYLLSMFPGFLILSLLGEKKFFNDGYIFFSLLFYGIFLSRFVQGYWAF